MRLLIAIATLSTLTLSACGRAEAAFTVPGAMSCEKFSDGPLVVFRCQIGTDTCYFPISGNVISCVD